MAWKCVRKEPQGRSLSYPGERNGEEGGGQAGCQTHLRVVTRNSEYGQGGEEDGEEVGYAGMSGTRGVHGEWYGVITRKGKTRMGIGRCTWGIAMRESMMEI